MKNQETKPETTTAPCSVMCSKRGCGADARTGHPCSDWNCPQRYVTAEEYRELERKLKNQRSHIAAYARALDGLLTPVQQAAIPGSGIDGYRDAQNIRRIVESLLSPNDGSEPTARTDARKHE